MLFSETETAKQNQKFPFNFFIRFAVEGWGEETRGKCKEIFWFLHTRVRERVRGALVHFTTQSERTRQFQATTRSAPKVLLPIFLMYLALTQLNFWTNVCIIYKSDNKISLHYPLLRHSFYSSCSFLVYRTVPTPLVSAYVLAISTPRLLVETAYTLM